MSVSAGNNEGEGVLIHEILCVKDIHQVELMKCYIHKCMLFFVNGISVPFFFKLIFISFFMGLV